MKALASVPNPSVPRPSLVRLGEIQVWSVTLHAGDERLAAFTRLLTGDELRRADRYRFADDRRRFIAARGTLRLLLADYTGQEAGGIAIETDPYGKPFLRAPRRPLHFNLAHSRDRALVAFSRDSNVGIDFEDLEHVGRIADLADAICSPDELSRIDGLSGECRSRALLRLWSAKEAFLKAMGTGLQIHPTRLEVSPGIMDGSAERGSVCWFDSPGASSRYFVQPMPDCEHRLGGSAAVSALKIPNLHRILWMGSPHLFKIEAAAA